MCLCVRVCVRARARVSAQVCTCTCLCERARVGTCVGICARMCAYVYVHVLFLIPTRELLVLKKKPSRELLSCARAHTGSHGDSGAYLVEADVNMLTPVRTHTPPHTHVQTHTHSPRSRRGQVAGRDTWEWGACERACVRVQDFDGLTV